MTVRESWFSVWTRRRFGAVLGGSLGAALGLATIAQSNAKNKKRKNKKKKRCRKIQATCTPGAKRRCCKGLICDEVVDLSGTFCCRVSGSPCSDNEDCCFPGACFEGECKPI
jgi:hypothetical protein